ncbi:hypothetical protein ASPTUDRAFT_309994 [Aspergillus tubingensis CBS 134.48]|uniref:Uncharacterized protein n=1 Tax=Aspergillus tubingensis (strain CBS 134.48) TaxID=767770 RepID=A0A1L9NQA0_ASPTC|nr:hypothetical protein ASPTUDRAFT_309994 [Aspergillus tubingensis CBS 134.48]
MNSQGSDMACYWNIAIYISCSVPEGILRNLAGYWSSFDTLTSPATGVKFLESLERKQWGGYCWLEEPMTVQLDLYRLITILIFHVTWMNIYVHIHWSS